MSAEWVTAIATSVTAIVIASSAAAALLQLRHMRGSNQIAAFTELRETFESEAFQDAQRFVSFELPERLTHPQESLRAAHLPFKDEYMAIERVADFFENVGVFVKNGVVDRSMTCDSWSYVVLRNWNTLAPVITYLRETLSVPALWENFEYLAVVSQTYADSHPSSYPAHMKRMPQDRSLIERIHGAP